MRHLAVVLTLVLASVAVASTARAECSFTIEVWPPDGAALPTNARIVLTASSSALFTEVADYRPRLRCQRRVVELKKIAEYFGAGLIGRQVVLAPVRSLPPGTLCELELDCEHCYPPPQRRWLTRTRADTASPQWMLPPYARGYWHDDGAFPCDSAYSYVISTPVWDDESELLVEARLSIRGSTAAPSVMLVDATGHVDLGHEACGAGFGLEPGPIYEVELVAVDVAGNRAAAESSVVFGLPAESTLPAHQWLALHQERAALLRELRRRRLFSPPAGDDGQLPVILASVMAALGLLLLVLVGRRRRRRDPHPRLGKLGR